MTIKTFGITALKSLKICLIIHFIITLCQSKHFAQSEGRRGGGGHGNDNNVQSAARRALAGKYKFKL